jgi:uncharacterized protein
MMNDKMTNEENPAGALKPSEVIRHSPSPWWTYGQVGLVIAGPAIVVVAALMTAWIAVRNQDPVLAEDYYRRGIEMNKTLAAHKAMAPVPQRRNEAGAPPATP